MTLMFLSNVILYLGQKRWSIICSTNTRKQKYNITRNYQDFTVIGDCLRYGDIIHLTYGEDVPADIKIITCHNIKVSNNLFSNQKIKSNFVSYATDEDILKSNNMLFKGSTIYSGTLTGMVINSEDETILNVLLAEVKTVLSGNNQNPRYCFTTTCLSFLAKFILLGLSIVIACDICLLLTGYIKLQLLVISVEILFILMTGTTFIIIMIILIIWSKKLCNSIFSKAEVLANLAKTDTLFINDISTLCEDKYTLSDMWIDGNIINGDRLLSSVQNDEVHYSPTWTALTRASVLCNDVDLSLNCDENGYFKEECFSNNNFNDIDTSLLRYFNNCESVKKWGGSLARYKQNNTSILLPIYDSASNCKMSIHRLNDGDPRLLLVFHGKPYDILNCCNTVFICGKEEYLTDVLKNNIIDGYTKLLAINHITRAFCDHRLSTEELPTDIKQISKDMFEIIPRQNLRFLGMISFGTSQNQSINLQISRCIELGIKLIILDSSSDISNIPNIKDINASELRIIAENSFDPVVINNSIILKKNDETIIQIIKFAQNNGKVVAFIGNALSDVKSLVAADIGIVSSRKSDYICQQFADICLTNDNFSTIISAIERSQYMMTILNNIITFLQYPKVTLVFWYIFFAFLGLPLPLNLTTILALELCSVLPALLLHFSGLTKNETNKFKLKNLSKGLIVDYGLIHQIGMIQLAAASFSYIIMMSLHGFWPRNLILIRNQWYLQTINDLTDSYGQEWTYSQRRDLDRMAGAVVFFVICFLQITSAILATSNTSIFKKKIKNLKQFLLLIASLILLFFILYFGSLLQVLDLQLFKYSIYLTVLPFFVYLFGFTEIRKYLKKHFNKSLWL